MLKHSDSIVWFDILTFLYRNYLVQVNALRNTAGTTHLSNRVHAKLWTTNIYKY